MFCDLGTTIVESFRGLRKFSRPSLPFSYRPLGLFSRQDAKNAKFEIIFFVCGLSAFARITPIRLRLCRARFFAVKFRGLEAVPGPPSRPDLSAQQLFHTLDDFFWLAYRLPAHFFHFFTQGGIRFELAQLDVVQES